MRILKMVEIVAIPHEGHEGYCRAGRRWTKGATPVEVVKCAEGDVLAPNQITSEQFAILDRDARIKVRVLVAEETSTKAPEKTGEPKA